MQYSLYVYTNNRTIKYRRELDKEEIVATINSLLSTYIRLENTKQLCINIDPIISTEKDKE